MRWGYDDYFQDYIPVSQRIANAVEFADEILEGKGRARSPIEIKGNKIAKTFWGQSWCKHLESYSDYSNRLPRGRTYVRNGSVVDLHITAGNISAVVGGSDTYQIDISISPLKPAHWKSIRTDCSSSIESLLDLLGGKLSDGVMHRLTDKKNGLFPSPREISMDCSCPDGARLCKHLAAVLYGIGARLDQEPQLLFLLRGVDHTELIGEAVASENLDNAFGTASGDFADADLGAMFGIELDSVAATPKPVVSKKRSSTKKQAAKKKPAKKRAAKKQAAKEKPATKTAATKQGQIKPVEATATVVKKKKMSVVKPSPAKGKSVSSKAEQPVRKASTKKVARK